MITFTSLLLVVSITCWFLYLPGFASQSGHGPSLASSYIEIIEPAALQGNRFPLQLSQFSLVPPQSTGLTAYVSLISPLTGCQDPVNPDLLRDSIVLVERGDCQFIDKALQIEKAGAVGYLISNIVDSTLPVPIASFDGSPPKRYLPLIGGSILGRDGNFIKALLTKGVPVRIRIVAESLERPI